MEVDLNIKMVETEIDTIIEHKLVGGGTFAHNFSDNADSMSALKGRLLMFDNNIPATLVPIVIGQILDIPLTKKVGGYAEMRPDNNFRDNINYREQDEYTLLDTSNNSRFKDNSFHEAIMLVYDSIKNEIQYKVLHGRVAPTYLKELKERKAKKERQLEQEQSLVEVKKMVTELSDGDKAKLTSALVDLLQQAMEEDNHGN